MSIRSRASALRGPEAGNFAWLLTEYGSRVVLTLGATALVARHLGSAEFATFGLLYTLIALVLPLSDAGLANVISRAIVAEERPVDVVLGTATAIRLLACLLGIPVLVGLAALSGGGYPGLVRFALLAGVLNAATSLSVIDYYYQAHLQAKVPAVARMTVLTGLALAQLALVLVDAGLSWFLLTLVIQQPLFGLAYLVHYQVRAGSSVARWRVEREYLGVLLRRSARMASSNLLEAVSLRAPVILLAQLGSAAAVGVLAVALRPVDIFRVLPNAASASILPRFVRTYRDDRAAFDRLVRRTTRTFLLLGAALSSVFVVFGPLATSLLFGSEFEAAGRAMQIYGPVLIFVFARAVFTKWVVTEEEYGLNLMVQGVGALVSVAASLVLLNVDPSAAMTATVLVMQAATTTMAAPLLHPAGRRYVRTVVGSPTGPRGAR